MAAPLIADRHKHHFHRQSPIKESVRCATTASITISTGLNVGDTIDGIVLADGDRVLVKDQATGSQNGIYVAGAVPVRAYDQSTDDPGWGFLVYVREGTTNSGKTFKNTNTAEPTIGTTAITFAQTLAIAVMALDDLTDVVITSATDGQILRRVSGTWVNRAMPNLLVEDDGAGAFNIVFEPDGSVIWDAE